MQPDSSQISSESTRSRRWGLLAGGLGFLAVWWFWRPVSDPVVLGLPDTGALDVATMPTVAALTVLMAIWWMTEAVPIPVTSLLPMVVLPLLLGGVFSLQDVTTDYANWRVYLFFGGFLIAIAMEACRLHRRFALQIIHTIGSSPRSIVLGFMIATAFLSMWISNTATSLMMLPIGLAVIDHFEGRPRFAVALMLGIAYGASIGGIGTLIGTPPNVSFQGVYGRLYPAAPAITFAQWMGLGLPLVLLFLPLVWWILVWRLPRSEADSRSLIKQELERLGSMTTAERRVLVVFVSTACLWIFRRPLDLQWLRIPGWIELLPHPGANDGVVAMAMGLLLFLIPSGVRGERLLNWELVQEKMPWGILLLFGGGFALAGAISQSGLSTYVGLQFGFLDGFHPLLLMLGSCLALTFLTEVTSNTATAEVMLPLTAGIATYAVEVNPLVLMLPVTLATSCAFMLPVATPPNAVIFATGRVPMREMIRHGLIINLLGVLLVSLCCYLLAPLVFGVDYAAGVPDWAIGR